MIPIWRDMCGKRIKLIDSNIIFKKTSQHNNDIVWNKATSNSK